mgnify:CR=1 FL=1
MVEKLSLFEMEEQNQEQMRINCSGALDIVKMEFSGAESLSWQELFPGTIHSMPLHILPASASSTACWTYCRGRDHFRLRRGHFLFSPGDYGLPVQDY